MTPDTRDAQKVRHPQSSVLPEAAAWAHRGTRWRGDSVDARVSSLKPKFTQTLTFFIRVKRCMLELGQPAEVVTIRHLLYAHSLHFVSSAHSPERSPSLWSFTDEHTLIQKKQTFCSDSPSTPSKKTGIVQRRNISSKEVSRSSFTIINL